MGEKERVNTLVLTQRSWGSEAAGGGRTKEGRGGGGAGKGVDGRVKEEGDAKKSTKEGTV